MSVDQEDQEVRPRTVRGRHRRVSKRNLRLPTGKEMLVVLRAVRLIFTARLLLTQHEALDIQWIARAFAEAVDVIQKLAGA